MSLTVALLTGGNNVAGDGPATGMQRDQVIGRQPPWMLLKVRDIHWLLAPIAKSALFDEGAFAEDQQLRLISL